MYESIDDLELDDQFKVTKNELDEVDEKIKKIVEMLDLKEGEIKADLWEIKANVEDEFVTLEKDKSLYSKVEYDQPAGMAIPVPDVYHKTVFNDIDTNLMNINRELKV